MQIKTDGIVIREQTIGESDRLITILTRSEGIIKAFARKAKSLKDSKNSSTGLLSYSRFDIFKGKDKYIVDNSEPIEIFFGLRNDIGRLSLAQYFCELSALLVPAETDSEEYLRLVLNSLYFLSKNSKPELMLKAVTELRMMAISGYMPDLIGCKGCGGFENEKFFFLPDSGIILCGNCYQKGDAPAVAMDMTVLTAMRHICYSDFSKLYAFSIDEEAYGLLSKVTETYTVRTMGHKINTLEFYKSIT